MSRPKKATIRNVEQALAFLDYQAAFAKGDTAANCSEIASVIRDLVAQVQGDYESEWLYVGSPADVATALMQRAWDDDVGDDMRTLLETGATALKASLERNVRLASVIEKSELGL
jgi:alkanesulfonate monooxygenase SsuD/methylene tetrahydromethanopterin reductase-like flavin-dependent oxidoreductase (luciferase family)